MPNLTTGILCEAIGGKLIKGQPEVRVRGVMSRCSHVVPGLIYFDVKGGAGGNRNIIEAIKNGAMGLVISKYKTNLPVEAARANIVVISVPNVWDAFWQAVKFYRDQYDIPVAGVTGTSGKTTTKEMIASIFKRRWKTLKTVGNMNLPDFVPSHLMRLRRGYQAAVFEIGMNRPGHISKQAKIIQPKVGIITHIGAGHVEHLGSIDKVILEKAGIIQGIPENGYLVLNADDVNTRRINLAGFKGKIVYYGLDNRADYNAENIRNTNQGIYFTVKIDKTAHEFFIPTFGRHNVYNALAAIATARIFGFDPATIKQGLARYRKPHMRLQIVPGVRNSTIINDTYNANPDSMMAGLEVLSTISGGKPKVAVLGNMLEQGQLSKVNHRKVGEKAAELKVDWLVTVGGLAKEIANGALQKDTCKNMKIWSFILRNQAVNFLRANLPRNAVVLVKGSRGAYMERLVKRLQ